MLVLPRTDEAAGSCGRAPDAPQLFYPIFRVGRLLKTQVGYELSLRAENARESFISGLINAFFSVLSPPELR